MHPIGQLLEVVGPGGHPEPGLSRTEQLRLSVIASLSSLALAGIWGLAAGSHAGRFAFQNAVTVPALLLASSLAALPLGLLIFCLTAPKGHWSDLILGHSTATFTGALVLALLSPIVALYQYSSSWAGPWVALGSAFVGAIVAVAILLRVLAKLVPIDARRSFVLPVVLLLIVQLGALCQLASVTDPVFQHRTLFGRGVDGLAPSGQVQP